MKLFTAIVLALASLTVAAQQPQNPSAPISPLKARYVQGGYDPTNGSELTLNIGGGTVYCAGTITTYAAGTLTMAASQTNYVYLNTSALCVPAVKTTTFVSGDIPIATVVTSASTITTISDDRTPFQTAGASGVASVSNTDGSLTVSPTSGAVVASLPSSGVTPGSYSNSNIVVNSKGIVTSASNGSGGSGSSTWIVDDFYFNSVNTIFQWFNGATTGTASATWSQGFSGHNGVWKLDGGNGTNSYIAMSWADGSGGPPLFGNATDSSFAIAFEAVGTSVSGGTVSIGVAGAGTVPNPGNSIYFECGSGIYGNSDWWILLNASSTGDQDTGVNCTSWHQLEISVAGTTATMYIDGAQVGTTVTINSYQYVPFFTAWNHSSASPDPVITVDWVASKVHTPNLQ